MAHDVWHEMETAVRDQLTLQVEPSLQRHHGFMLSHGLAECRDVIDIGTGSGLFLSRIAAQHSGIRFHGIDNQHQMVEEGKTRPSRNIDWVIADALGRRTKELLTVTHGIIMRYFLLREASLYHCCLYGTSGDEELRPLRDFLRHRMTRDSHFVQYGMAMVSAVRQHL